MKENKNVCTSTEEAMTNLNECKSEIRAILKTVDDFQGARIRLDNRLKRKADGTSQKDAKTNAPKVTKDSIIDTKALSKSVLSIEDGLTKQLEARVKQTPEWKFYFKDIKGIGPKMASILISEIDPYKAETVSKIWQYAGLNGSKVFGKKKNKDGSITVTTDLVRGDRPTAGYILPYNCYLKMCVVGKMATQLMMAKNPRYMAIYEGAKNFYSTNPKWKDESALHIHRASVRKMMKQFLADYYAFVRPYYGLETRVPYAEEKMGIKHHFAKIDE